MPGWVRGTAAGLSAAVLIGVPSTALAAGGHGNSAAAHAAIAARRAAAASASAAPRPQVLRQAAPPAATAAPPAASPAPAPTPTPTPLVAAAPAPPPAVVAAVPAVRLLAPAGAGALLPLATRLPGPVAGPPVAPAPRPLRDGPALQGFPDVVLPPGPDGVRISVALLALPLLLALALWAVVRSLEAAWRLRGNRTRTQLARHLGVAPAELVGLGGPGLQRLSDQVAFDELTGVARRAVGLSALKREVARARREAVSLSVAFIDVDGLKEMNDSGGHGAGDRLLQGVAGLLTGRLRGQDTVFRYGGDEFVVLLPDTPETVAAPLIEDVRRRAAAAGLPFSYGVAALRAGESSDHLLRRADARQYEDKRARHAARS